MRHIKFFFFTALVLLTITVIPSLAVARGECSECHSDWLSAAKSRPVVHPPFAEDGCSSCHDDHGDDGKLVLVEEGEALCLQCHDDPADKGKVHPIIEDDGCLDCHNPHSSVNKNLLVESPKNLCLDCHDDKLDGPVVHEAAMDGGCTDCHDPHSSKNDHLLVENPPALCAECHDVPNMNDSVLHTALSDGDCTDCHFPHAGNRPKLLKDEYETKPYPKGFSEKMYALCFDCHDVALVTGQAESTGFRDGKKNLHNVHVVGALVPNKYGIVKREKARSCSMCHDPHGSTQEFNLISNYSRNGISMYSLNYTPLKDGGRCIVGCHKPRSYHRTTTAGAQ